MIKRVLALVLAGCAGSPRIAREPKPDRQVLRVVTYNVNFGIPGDAATIDAIAHADGDVVLLQETNQTWEAALIRALGDRYPWRNFEHRPAAGGAGVLSKHPIESIEVLEPTAAGAWFPAMRIVVRAPGGPVQLLNVHLRPQISDTGSVVSGYFSTPKVRASEVADYAAKLDPNLPTLVAGDFNESTTGDATEALGQRGFIDALNEFAPGAKTWRWPTSIGKIESGLDRIMYRANEGLEPIDAKVLPKGRSDHLPVVTIFEHIPVVAR